MKILLIILLLLLLLSLVPLGVRVRYDQDGFFAFAKVWFVRLQVYPAKPKGKRDKPPKKPKEKPPEAEEHPKGGALDLVRAALPLVKPALAGIKKRLTIQDLELHVAWAAANPADAAMGYGSANAALGMLWAVIQENFKVKKSRLGCSVDFDEPSPTVYLNATLTMRLGQIVTLGVPLLVRFLRNSVRIKRTKNQKAEAEKTKKEA